MIRFLCIITLPVVLYACMNVKENYSALMTDGKARNVPLLIYDTSWNNPHVLYGTRMEVSLIITGDEKINSVMLQTASCGSKGSVGRMRLLNLDGPFIPGKAYTIYPTWPVQYSQWISHEQSVVNAKYSSHIVIKAVVVNFNTRNQTIYDKNVSQIITSNISNYCANTTY